MSTLYTLAQGSVRAIDLVTFKQSGEAVHTPVWFAPEPSSPQRLFVYTNRNSWKVKRLRRNPEVRVAACDMRGRRAGPGFSAMAETIEDPQDPKFVRGFELLERRYGVWLKLVLAGARLSGRYRNRCIIHIIADPDSRDSD